MKRHLPLRMARGVFTALLLCAAIVFSAEIPEGVIPPVKNGGDTIAGDLPGVLVAKPRPYLVIGDIYVPQGKTVIVEAGAVFLFKSFTGLHVSGTLLAHGTKFKPVVFTSENDKAYNRTSAVDPAPFDWNGIYLHEDAIGSQLSYCAVLYSVDGMSSLTKFFRLNPCLFLHNGRANLTIMGVQYNVTDQPYEYALSANDPSLKGVPLSILTDPNAFSRNVFRYSGATIGFAGLFMGIVYADKLISSSREFASVSSADRTNLAVNSNATWKEKRNDKNKDFATVLAATGVLIIGLIGVGWSFSF